MKTDLNFSTYGELMLLVNKTVMKTDPNFITYGELMLHVNMLWRQI